MIQNAGNLLYSIAMNIDTPLCVEIVRRDEQNCVTHKAVVPVRHIKSDFDGSGITIRVDESDIVFKKHY